MVATNSGQGNGTSRPAPGVRPRCLACGQVVSADARSCPWCGRALLYDVMVVEPPTGGGAARAARELEILGLGAKGVLARRLGEAPCVLLSSVTRAVAASCLESLARHRLAARLVPVQPVAASPEKEKRDIRGLRSKLVLGALLAATVLALGYAFWAGVDTMSTAAHPRPVKQEGFPVGPARLVVASLARRTDDSSPASGFLVGNHLAVTTARVAAESGDALAVDGWEQAHVARCDEWLDVALVELVGPGGHPLELGDPTQLERGDRVQLPGTAGGSARVSQPVLVMMGLAYLALDVTLAPADCGGPVLDASGRVVAILSGLTVEHGATALAVPVAYLGDGPDPLLPEAGPAAGEAWKRWLEQAGLPGCRRAEDLAREVERPFLIEARAGRRSASVVVGRFSTRLPPSGELAFQLLHNEQPLCSPEASVPFWHPISVAATEDRMPYQAKWLQRRGQSVYLYTASLTVRLDACDRRKAASATMAVRDGLPNVKPVQLRHKRR